MRKYQTSTEIHTELVSGYGDSALPPSTVRRWMTQFRAGRQSFEDEVVTVIGEPVDISTTWFMKIFDLPDQF